jgi:hypothetical protein
MSTEQDTESRRRFLLKCGKVAVATPPTMALLLSVDERGYALAFSGGAHPGNGNGNGPPEDHLRRIRRRRRFRRLRRFGRGRRG